MSPRQRADLLMLRVPPTRPLPCTCPETISGPRVSTSPTTVELSEITVGDMPSRSESLRLGSSVIGHSAAVLGVYNESSAISRLGDHNHVRPRARDRVRSLALVA